MTDNPEWLKDFEAFAVHMGLSMEWRCDHYHDRVTSICYASFLVAKRKDAEELAALRAERKTLVEVANAERKLLKEQLTLALADAAHVRQANENYRRENAIAVEQLTLAQLDSKRLRQELEELKNG